MPKDHAGVREELSEPLLSPFEVSRFVHGNTTLSQQPIDRTALLRAAAGTLLESNAPPLPAPPLLGFDEISELACVNGAYGQGFAVARKSTEDLQWVFNCHFPTDPVMPGALMLDALLQLTGFYGGVLGFVGQGRATKIGEVRFLREIRPATKFIEYRIEVRRVLHRAQAVVTDGIVIADGVKCLSASCLAVCIIKNVVDLHCMAVGAESAVTE